MITVASKKCHDVRKDPRRCIVPSDAFEAPRQGNVKLVGSERVHQVKVAQIGPAPPEAIVVF
jgi:hypothetical protein